MPRNRFVPRKITEEDETRALELEKGASKYPSQVLSYIQHFRDFIRKNREEVAGKDASFILRHFGHQWRESGRRLSSLNTMLKSLKNFRIEPGTPGWVTKARRAVRRYAIRNAVEREAKAAGKKMKRVRLKTPLDGVSATRPKNRDERDRHAFWALVCVTGSRPEHILGIRGLKVGRDRVSVHWGRRKIRSDVTGDYLWKWSEKPPSYVLKRWATLETHPWVFARSSNIASALDGWLKRKWLTPYISSSARETIDVNSIAPLVRENKIRDEDYEILMDHTYATHLSHYR